MLVLLETLAGYVVFKAMETNKLSEIDHLFVHNSGPPKSVPTFTLSQFNHFKNIMILEAQSKKATPSMVEGGASPNEQKHCIIDTIRKSKLDAEMPNVNIQKLLAYIRDRVKYAYANKTVNSVAGPNALVDDSPGNNGTDDISTDVKGAIIIQVQDLIDIMDRMLDGVVQQYRDEYNSHFPELNNILQDDLQFVSVINMIGNRHNIFGTDLTTLLSPAVIQKIKTAAVHSNGLEMSREKIMTLQFKCGIVASQLDFKKYLDDILKAGMLSFAPNLTALVGVEAGADFIVRAGSLVNLAVLPESAYQFQGAHKPLRHKQNVTNADRKNVVYRAHLVNQSTKAFRGTMTTTLAKRIIAAVRLDLQTGTKFDFESNLKIDLGQLPNRTDESSIKVDNDEASKTDYSDINEVKEEEGSELKDDNAATKAEGKDDEVVKKKAEEIVDNQTEDILYDIVDEVVAEFVEDIFFDMFVETIHVNVEDNVAVKHGAKAVMKLQDNTEAKNDANQEAKPNNIPLRDKKVAEPSNLPIGVAPVFPIMIHLDVEPAQESEEELTDDDEDDDDDDDEDDADADEDDNNDRDDEEAEEADEEVEEEEEDVQEDQPVVHSSDDVDDDDDDDDFGMGD